MTTVMQVPLRRFGRTELRVPTISLGTWAYGGENVAGKAEIGWSGHDDGQARAALRRAHALGISHWDTADVYGDGRSEALIGGMWDEVPRDAVVLASKVGYDRGGRVDAYAPEVMQRQLDRSLAGLRTDRIDVYYLHHCDFGPDDRQLDGAVAFLQAARAAGKIRFIGLSDWSDHKIMRVIAQVDPDVVQPFRNVTHDHFYDSGLAAWCHQHDVGVAFFSPLRHGLLLGKYDTPTTFPHGDVRNADGAFRDATTLARLKVNAHSLTARFGDRSREPVIGALVTAILADAKTGCVLLGQRNPAQVEAAAHAAGLAVDEEELAWVRSLYAGISGN